MICLLVQIPGCVCLPLHVPREQGWGFFTPHSISQVQSSAWHLTGLKNDSKWRIDKGSKDQCDEGYEGGVQGAQEELTGS